MSASKILPLPHINEFRKANADHAEANALYAQRTAITCYINANKESIKKAMKSHPDFKDATAGLPMMQAFVKQVGMPKNMHEYELQSNAARKQLLVLITTWRNETKKVKKEKSMKNRVYKSVLPDGWVKVPRSELLRAYFFNAGLNLGSAAKPFHLVDGKVPPGMLTLTDKARTPTKKQKATVAPVAPGAPMKKIRR